MFASHLTTVRSTSSPSSYQMTTNGEYFSLPYNRNSIAVWSIDDLTSKVSLAFVSFFVNVTLFVLLVTFKSCIDTLLEIDHIMHCDYIHSPFNLKDTESSYRLYDSVTTLHQLCFAPLLRITLFYGTLNMPKAVVIQVFTMAIDKVIQVAF